MLDYALQVCRDEGPVPSEIPNLTYRRDGEVVENELSYCAVTQGLDELDFVDMGFLLHAEQ